jgi:putative hydrolase of the HAD superfamily
MLPEAIFFDLDDTLLRNTIASELVWRKACEAAATETTIFQAAELLHQIDAVRDWYWSDTERHRSGRLNLHEARTSIVRMALEKLGRTDDKIASTVAAKYSLLVDESLEFSPNTEEVLGQLVKKQVKMALLTNGAGAVQREKIKRFGLDRYFSVCLIEGELGWGKPDRHVFQTALDKLAVTPKQTWMVGDDLERDIEGAQQAGIFTIWYDYRKKGLHEGSKVKPDKIIKNITELLSL